MPPFSKRRSGAGVLGYTSFLSTPKVCAFNVHTPFGVLLLVLPAGAPERPSRWLCPARTALQRCCEEVRLRRRRRKGEILTPPDRRQCGKLTGMQLFAVANAESLLLKLFIIRSE